MSYYDEVYIKRLNQHGTNRQDRVKSSKEMRFDRIFMKRTEYLATLYKVNGIDTDVKISLQPNKWNESSLISNVLMSTSAAPLKTGDILNIKMQIKDAIQDKIWLVIFVEENLTKGYQLFKVICLDTEINITDEYGNSILSTPAKVVNSLSSIMQDTIIRNANELGYREPFTTNIVICQSNEALEKGKYFEYKDRGWEIVGKNGVDIIPNVTYLYISEKLYRENQPLSSEDILVGENDNFFLNGR